jgi:hypothetical protein
MLVFVFRLHAVNSAAEDSSNWTLVAAIFSAKNIPLQEREIPVGEVAHSD